MNEVKSQTNGTCSYTDENEHEHEHDHDHDHDVNSSEKEALADVLTSSQHVDAYHPNAVEEKKPELFDSSSSPTKATPFIPAEMPPITNKGFGLKKWRRIRREITKDTTPDVDSTKMLKRGSGILDGKSPSDVSLSSTYAFVNNSQAALSSNSSLAVNVTFNAGVDSDNSEDRSSKSSTAASAPKYRCDALRAPGHHQRDKHRTKNVGGRNLNSVSQRAQLVKGLTDMSKKPRGEKINLENENSFSSMESDSRSSNTVFMRGTSSAISGQVQSGSPLNYDREHAYNEQAFEEQSAEELRAGGSENVSLSPDDSAEISWNSNNGKSKNHQLSKDCDQLVNSILMLQSAQDALERELEKFKKIGLSETMDNVPAACPVSDTWDSEFNHVNKNIQTLEKRLSEAESRLKERESRIIELETTIKSVVPPREDLKGKMQCEKCHEIETEVEGLFEQKIEVEIQYVALARFREELNVLVEEQIKLLREPKSGVKDQVQNKDAMLQDEGEENVKIGRQLVKFSSCFFIQLILFVLLLVLFALRLLPTSTVVVPT